MKNTRYIGLAFVAVSLPFLWLHLKLLGAFEESFLLIDVFAAGFMGLGIGILIMPGYQPTQEEWDNKKERFEIIQKKTSSNVLIFWLALIIAFLTLMRVGIL